MIRTRTKLYEHQTKAIEHIKNRKVFALYMDMGTGKTRTIIEYWKLRNIKRVIYFCPVCLKQTIYYEMNKHILNSSCLLVDKERMISNRYKIYIVGIESVNSDRVYLAVMDLINRFRSPFMIVVDESSYIKSFWAQRTHRIIAIARISTYRCVMTGTPLTRFYQDIFMQFRFLDSTILKYSSYHGFCSRYVKYHEKYRGFVIGYKNINELMDCLYDHIFQIKKQECLDLPEKIYNKRFFQMSQIQRLRYDRTKKEFFDSIMEEECVDRIEIFKLFTKLQKIVSYHSRKRLESLLSILKEIDPEEKIIIFCKYYNEIRFIKRKLPEAVLYTGKVSLLERKNILENLDKIQIMIASYGVGGYGLNLQQFGHCVFYSNTYNYADRIQAEDRLHRIGQKRNVMYYSLICSGSIDEHIESNINMKKSFLERFERETKIRKSKQLLSFIEQI